MILCVVSGGGGGGGGTCMRCYYFENIGLVERYKLSFHWIWCVCVCLSVCLSVCEERVIFGGEYRTSSKTPYAKNGKKIVWGILLIIETDMCDPLLHTCRQ